MIVVDVMYLTIRRLVSECFVIITTQKIPNINNNTTIILLLFIQSIQGKLLDANPYRYVRPDTSVKIRRFQ
jgi:hypothetical protein